MADIGAVPRGSVPNDIGAVWLTLYNFLRRYEHTPATNTQLRM